MKTRFSALLAAVLFSVTAATALVAPQTAMAQAAASADAEQRRLLLEQAERTMLKDHPLVPVFFYVNKHLVKPEVHGWYDNVMNVVYSKDLSLASVTPQPAAAARRSPSSRPGAKEF